MTHLASDSTFEQHRGVVVDELELLEDIHSRVIIRQQLQVLIGKSQLK